jgi:hypothetical protein
MEERSLSAAAQPLRSAPVSFGALVLRHGAPAIALLVYMTYWLLHLLAPTAYQQVLIGLGRLGPYPFYDLDAVLAAIDCARRGVEVTLPNACMDGGAFQYSPLLLEAAVLPIGPAQRVTLGLPLDLCFLLSLFALPPPRRWSEFRILLLALLSSSVAMAMESANIDVALYLLVFGAVHLLLRGTGARLLGCSVLLGAAAIKFYPACLLILAVREPPGRFVAIMLGCLLAAVLLAASFPLELGHVLVNLPQGGPGAVFAASNLPFGLASLVPGGDADHGIGLAVRTASTMVLIGACAAMAWRHVPAMLPGFRALPDRERLLLVTGAVAMAFCFLAASNFMYREIFLLLALPGLWHLESGARFRRASWVVVALLWSAFFQTGLVRALTEPFAGLRVVTVLWLLRELCWWWLTGLLLGVILCFLRDAPVFQGWRLRAAA